MTDHHIKKQTRTGALSDYPVVVSDDDRHDVADDCRHTVGFAEGRETMCVICQEEMESDASTITHCKWGNVCGNAFHEECFDALVAASTDIFAPEPQPTKCPMCRGLLQPWPTYTLRISTEAEAARIEARRAAIEREDQLPDLSADYRDLLDISENPDEGHDARVEVIMITIRTGQQVPDFIQSAWNVGWTAAYTEAETLIWAADQMRSEVPIGVIRAEVQRSLADIERSATEEERFLAEMEQSQAEAELEREIVEGMAEERRAADEEARLAGLAAEEEAASRRRARQRANRRRAARRRATSAPEPRLPDSYRPSEIRDPIASTRQVTEHSRSLPTVQQIRAHIPRRGGVRLSALMHWVNGRTFIEPYQLPTIMTRIGMAGVVDRETDMVTPFPSFY